MTLRSAVAALLALAAASTPALAAPPPVEKFLTAGKLSEAESILTASLNAFPKDDQARFALGVVRFLRGIERFAQFAHRHGAGGSKTLARDLPFLRLAVGETEHPVATNYGTLRQALVNLQDDLAAAEKTLAEITDPDVKLPLHVALVRLDLNGDGKAEDDETLWKVYGRVAPVGRIDEKQAGAFVIGFDRADVAWLRGYCHLLSAMLDVVLAYDWSELFECCAHLAFAKADTRHVAYLDSKEQRMGFWGGGGETDIRDLIAFVHLLRFPLKEPERMKSARGQLQQMLALSRESWKLALAENDDDHEWLPNPNQTGVVGIKVSREMIDSWIVFTREADQLLDGRKLVPFWRGAFGERGVNLRRVFEDPRDLDVVLWVQGTGAAPYLETGPLTDLAVWDRMRRAFGGDFVTFAVWFN
jgi:hypothetical protein